MTLTDNLLNNFKELKKSELVLSYIIRIGYILFTLPMFMLLADLEYDQTKIFGIEIFNIILFLMFVFGFLVVYFMDDIYQLKKPIAERMNNYNIKFSKNSMPGIVFLLSIGLLWVDYFLDYFYIVYSIFALALIEIYFIQEKKALNEYRKVISKNTTP